MAVARCEPPAPGAKVSAWRTLIRMLSTDSGLTFSDGERPFFDESQERGL
jgi:hypothetical protein